MSCFDRNDRGAATTELVIAVPLFLLLLMLIVQFALWEHGIHVAQTAAEHGARALRLEGGTIADGEDAAQEFLAQNGSQVVMGSHITATRDATTARLEITAHGENVVPWLTLPIHVVSTGPVEAYR